MLAARGRNLRFASLFRTLVAIPLMVGICVSLDLFVFANALALHLCCSSMVEELNQLVPGLVDFLGFLVPTGSRKNPAG